MGYQTILEKKLHQNERIYREACTIFGGEPRVFRYYDQSDEVSIDLLTVEDAPLPDIVSYSTLGLIHYPKIAPSVEAVPDGGFPVVEKPCRMEIAGACRRKHEYLPNLLSFCCFEIINARFQCYHGSVYPDIINTYMQGSPLKHVLFVSIGGVWEKPMPRLEFEDKTVQWLNAIPISDGEFTYLETHGTEALLDLFREHKIDPYHWERKSLL